MENDTICAISTPPGVGGIAVARVSGPRAFEIVSRIWHGRRPESMESHTAHLGTVSDSDGNQLDQSVMTVYRAPRSFTGDDVVEIACHGSKYVQRELLNSLVGAGARIAEPGEFTRRAFASGKMDLAEAEAVADIIASTSRAAHRIAVSHMRGNYSARLNELRQQLLDLASLLELELDFSEEEVEFASRERLLELARSVSREVNGMYRSFASGAAIKDGIRVAIVGKTNAGKSSLLNAIVGDERAIVSDIHGTTRDIVEDTVEIGDYLFRFSDTAGLRETTDTIERLGIDRSYSAAERSRVVVLVCDATAGLDGETLADVVSHMDKTEQTLVIAMNKCDRLDDSGIESIAKTIAGNPMLADAGDNVKVIYLSAKTGEGIDRLQTALTDIVAESDTGDHTLVTNARHAEALHNASDSIARVIDGLTAGISGDFIAQDLRETIHHLGTITGTITAPDILASIFSRFCIGK